MSTPAAATATDTRQVNGQVELTDPAAIGASRYANPELIPVPRSRCAQHCGKQHIHEAVHQRIRGVLVPRHREHTPNRVV